MKHLISVASPFIIASNRSTHENDYITRGVKYWAVVSSCRAVVSSSLCYQSTATAEPWYIQRAKTTINNPGQKKEHVWTVEVNEYSVLVQLFSSVVRINRLCYTVVTIQLFNFIHKFLSTLRNSGVSAFQGLKCTAYNRNAIRTWAKRQLKRGVRGSE